MKDEWPSTKQVMWCGASRFVAGVQGGFTLRPVLQWWAECWMIGEEMCVSRIAVFLCLGLFKE